jgi:hypothetical protein
MADRRFPLGRLHRIVGCGGRAPGGRPMHRRRVTSSLLVKALLGLGCCCALSSGCARYAEERTAFSGRDTVVAPSGYGSAMPGTRAVASVERDD